MEIYEITGLLTGIDNRGVNFLEPADSFKSLKNGYIYRQELKSRNGFKKFGTRLDGLGVGETPDGTRVMGIFENIHPDSTIELLVITKKFLYTYDQGSDSFLQIPFNSVDPITDFGITNNEDYVSGTTYFTKDGAERFVFTGRGMDDIYFYDGTSVKRFTNGGVGGDNPDYEDPPEGALTRADVVIWFGERLNFFSPFIGGVPYPQGVLYSGIRNSAGNGDKFNVSGAGILSADTYEYMRGAKILGNIVVMTFVNSTWTLEKTTDAFNPYIVRKIPSVIGTDATFSSAVWNYELKSIGKRGMISTDGRESVRFDNKIPYFSNNKIDQDDFELTYGGFDRINGQFLFSYLDSLNDGLSTQDKVLVYNYEESSWSINDQRFSVFGLTESGTGFIWDDIYEVNDPSWERMDTTEEIWNKIGLTTATYKTLAGDDDAFVYEINSRFDDYAVGITGITNAPAAVVSIQDSAFKEGDEVIFQNVEGMIEINGLIGTVTAASLNSITVNINSTDFTPYTTAGLVSKVIAFEAESNLFNPYRPNGRKCYVQRIDVLVNRINDPLAQISNATQLYIDLYEDGESDPFKTSPLIPSSYSLEKQRQWISVAVNQESEFFSFKIRRKSASTQTIITSIRIYCSPGAMIDS